MGLKLNTVPARRGLWWVREGFRETLRHPFGYAGLFAVFMLAVMLLGVLGALGGVLLLAMVPLLSLGFTMAVAGARRGVPVQAGVYLAPWRGTPAPQRRRLLLLCLSYALATLLVLWLCEQIDGGGFEELAGLLMEGKLGTPEWVVLVETPGVREGMLARALLSTLVSLPFWHAAALVHWGGQGVAQALFSSALSVWRARGAYTLYGLGWMAAAMAAGLLALGLVLLGAGVLLPVLVLPLSLLLTTAFYTSLYASFVDSFVVSSED